MFGGAEGRQVLDYLTRSGYGRREYLSGGQWVPLPEGKVTGTRYEMGNVLEEINDLAYVWRSIKNRSLERPEKPDKILEQLASARMKPEKLRLFSPWGPRYNKKTPQIEASDPETATLREIRDLFQMFSSSGYEVDFLLMPADTYGTEINKLPPAFVGEYFKWLEDSAYSELGNIGIRIEPWSHIREANEMKYTKMRDEIGWNFDSYISSSEYARALKTARVFNPANPMESAVKYCIERVAEAAIINELYDPVKLSLVRKEKDSLDGPLKRIYVIRNKAPWIKE